MIIIFIVLHRSGQTKSAYTWEVYTSGYTLKSPPVPDMEKVQSWYSRPLLLLLFLHNQIETTLHNVLCVVFARD